jgi:fibronectin type 3 domain-containing protein
VTTPTGSGPVPSPPIIVSATAVSSNSITVRWNAVSGADGYRVYRSSTEAGTYKRVSRQDINTNAYTDLGLSAGKTYYYKVSAYNNNGEGPRSSIASAIVSNNSRTGLSYSTVSGSSASNREARK